MIELIMKPTGKRDRWDFRQFDLALTNNGKAVDRVTVISGGGAAQYERFVYPTKDYSGSFRPVPEGIYLIGKPEHGWWGEAIGEIWIGLEAIKSSKVNDRENIGMHCDYNRRIPGYMGSAGCVCTYDNAGIERIAQWCEAQHPPEHLVVDYGLGFLASIGYQYLAA